MMLGVGMAWLSLTAGCSPNAKCATCKGNVEAGGLLIQQRGGALLLQVGEQGRVLPSAHAAVR